MRNRIGNLSIRGLCVVLCLPVLAAAEPAARWELAAGMDYSSGSYGGSVDTDILYVPLIVRTQVERLKFELTVPYMRLEGPGNVVGGGGPPIVIDAVQGSVVTSSGLGDLVTGVTYLVPQLSDGGPFLELRAKLKIPTADETLGTEQADYSVQVDAYQMAGARVTLIAGIGYQWLGDPEGLELEDGVIGTLGFNLKTTPTMDIGVLFDHRRESFAGLDDQQTLVPYVSWRTARNMGFTLYAVSGLTEASPEYGAGLQFTYSLNSR